MEKNEIYAIGIAVVVIMILGAGAVYFELIDFGGEPPIVPECPTGQIKCADGTCKASCTVVPPAETLSTNLVFYAPLKTNAVEQVSGKTGTSTGVIFENGYAKFNGGSSNIKYTYDSKTYNSGGLGISACVRVDDPTKHSYFVSKYGSYTVQNYAFNNATTKYNRFDGLIYKSSSNWSSVGKTAPIAGTWYHVVMNYDGAVEKMYINKALDGSKTLNYPIINNPSYGITIGNREDTLQRGLVGAVKNARVYSTPLSENQRNLAYAECFN